MQEGKHININREENFTGSNLRLFFESVENLKTKRNNKKTKARKKKGCFYL